MTTEHVDRFRWRGMRKSPAVLAVLLIAGCGASTNPHIGTHTSNRQDRETAYLNNLAGSEFYQRLGKDALISEGYKVCQSHSQGMTDADIRKMVRQDLGVSSSGAMDVKVAAEMYLGC